MPGSIKTNAPRVFLYDLFRAWIKDNPVTMSNIKEGSPARTLLAKAAKYVHNGNFCTLHSIARFCRHEVNLNKHADVDRTMLISIKLVKYAENPPNSGPASKAVIKQK